MRSKTVPFTTRGISVVLFTGTLFLISSSFVLAQEAMHISADGKVGVGTTVPEEEIHVLSTSGNAALRLEAPGSPGSNWIIRGQPNGQFQYRDHARGTIPFRIGPGAQNNLLNIGMSPDGTTADATRVNISGELYVNGKTGLGTDTPMAPLHLLKSGTSFSAWIETGLLVQNNATVGDAAIASLLAGASGTAQLSFGDADNQFAGRFLFNHANDKLRIDIGGTNGLLSFSNGANTIEHIGGAMLTQGGQWQNASSRALKENISPLSAEAALQAFSELLPVTYNYKAEPNEISVGFVAEDVPDLVATASRETLTSLDLVAVVTRVVQEQQSLISSQAKTIAELSARVAVLEAEREN